MANIIYDKNIKHPNTFSSISGDTQYIKEINAINQSIRLILTTVRGELFGDPNFGCRLKEYLFDLEGPALEGLIKKEISSCLTRQEPRIFVRESDIDTEYDQENVIITINYNLKYTDYVETFEYIINKKEKTYGSI